MAIEFDKDIPIPPPQQRTKYEFDRMEVGDSKFWPGEAAGKAVVAYARKSGKKFATRKEVQTSEENEEVSGLRVWRTE